MLKITLEAIEVVDAIARHGSFAAAAAIGRRIAQA